MKTFVLKMLSVFDQKDGHIVQKKITLLEGLIINREDDSNRWVIEAYIEKDYREFFKQLQEKNEDVMLQVKITKESNDPATFITSILDINEIGENINVLFIGTIIERKANIVEELTELLEAGYRGSNLLKKINESTGEDIS